MRRSALRFSIAAWGLAVAEAVFAQAPPATIPLNAAPVAATQAAASASEQNVTGGKLHGVAKSGVVPLPGVTVTALNTLTGKRYSTTTDITGAWSLTIPQDGRYVIRTQFAAFAQKSDEALLNQTGRDRTVNFQLILASRAAEQEQREALQTRQAESQAGVEQVIQQMS